MTLVLGPSKVALRPGLTVNFSGFNGVPPYSYSVLSGPGSVDQNGNFTSVKTYAQTVLQVIDSQNNTAIATATTMHPLQLFCDILEQGLGLPHGRVWLFNQKINEPTDSDLYCVVHLLGDKIFGSGNSQDGSNQDQTINTMATLQFDLKSRNTAALFSRLKAVQSLSSNYSAQQQSLNSFKIFRLPKSLVNLSSLDGAAIPYRFSGTCCIMYSDENISPISYYDTFPQPTIVEDL